MKKFSAQPSAVNATNYVKMLFVALALLISALSTSVYGQATTELVFSNPTLVSGVQGKDGAVYRFSTVYTNTDALVTIKGRSSTQVELNNIDIASFGSGNAFQPRLGWTGGCVYNATKWWMEFQIDFVKKGTNDLSNKKELSATMMDVDGDGCALREFYQLNRVEEYKLEATTELTKRTVTGNAVEINGSAKNYHLIDVAAGTVKCNSTYKSKSSITFKVGAEVAENGVSLDAMRYNSMLFCTVAAAQSLLPVSIVNWAATTTKGNVNLKWSTTAERNSSHFVVERSFNGNEFSEIAMLIAAGTSDATLNYEYNDNLPEAGNGRVYYRFKAVDLDGSAKYSDVRMIRFGKTSTSIKLTAYPNPLVNEISVTVPGNWQGKAVTYQVVAVNGRVVKSISVKSASQIQSILMNDVPAGMYIVRAATETETAMQQVLKAK